MNVIIAGAGEVGGHAARVLSAAGHSVTIIDLSAEKLGKLSDTVDLRTLVGHCAHLDEINMLSASVARAVGVKKAFVRVHHTANFALRRTPYARQLGIDEFICPEHLTSLAIARSIRNPGSIALEEFAHGKLQMQRFRVAEKASALGRPLAEVVLPEGTRVATLERDGAASIAEAKTVVRPDDMITLIGKTETFEQARKLFGKSKSKRIDIAVMGETMTATWLCRAFRGRAFSVRLFVTSHDRAEELSEKLPHVTVLIADPTESTTFSDEHLEKTDAFIATTDNDERNILACALAKTFGAARVIVVLQGTTYRHLLGHLGVDEVFCPSEVAVKTILHSIETGSVRSLATFADDQAEVYEIRPSKKAKVFGHELRNVKLPQRSMIAAIRRGGEVHVPGADDQIALGDVLLVIGPCGVDAQLTELFGNK